MKKTLSFMMALILLFAVGGFAASAGAPDEPFVPQKVVIGTFGDYEMYHYTSEIELPMEVTEQIGKYVFYRADFREDPQFESNLGLYVGKGEELHSLALAYEKGLIDLDVAASEIAKSDAGVLVYLLGDVNANGKVDMDDILQAQKEIANLSVSAGQPYFWDCTNDGFTNTQDVLIMQKVVANMYEIV